MDGEVRRWEDKVEDTEETVSARSRVVREEREKRRPCEGAVWRGIMVGMGKSGEGGGRRKTNTNGKRTEFYFCRMARSSCKMCERLEASE